MKAYEMEMQFTASIGLKAINSILHDIGSNDTCQIKDGLTISIKQILSGIPDDDYIHKVEQILMEHYETKDINILECHFSGYTYLKEIDIPDTETKPEQSKPN